MMSNERESVSFISTELGRDLVVAYAIGLSQPGEVETIILQRTPEFEFILPPEDRGVVISHERFPGDERDLVRRIVVDGRDVDIETTLRTYRLDLSGVDRDEVADARKVLTRMNRRGGFDLTIR
jgi:hypothetical protein